MNQFICNHCPKGFPDRDRYEHHVVTAHALEEMPQKPGLEPKAWAATLLACCFVGVLIVGILLGGNYER